MPPKQKGAAAQNKTDAPPSKRSKGKKVEETSESSESEYSEEEKIPPVSPDQGATSATPIIVPKKLESAWFQFLKKGKRTKTFADVTRS